MKIATSPIRGHRLVGLSFTLSLSLSLLVSAFPASGQALPPEQLENLVAPIALYPDPLLSQILAASTYPLEIVEAAQWVQQNGDLSGGQLMEAAKMQPWDPSVQALTAFPDALSMLSRDVRWTTALGNAFLAQDQDVMAAIQRMRYRAQQNGRLASTPQQVVSTEVQEGQTAIVIQPADPQIIYVPVYNPQYIWGAPEYGYYPPLWYPSISYGFGFGPRIYLTSYFPAWGGWAVGGWGRGWGWGCGWFGRGGGVVVNNYFFEHHGFREPYRGGEYGGRGRFGGAYAGGRTEWQHDPLHRAGVSYPNHAIATRFNTERFASGRSAGAAVNGQRPYAGGSGWRGAGPGTQAGPAERGPSSNYNRGGANNPYAGGYGTGRNSVGQTFGRPSVGAGGSRGNYVAPTPNYSGSGSRGNYVAPTPNYSGGGSRGSYLAPTPNYSGGGGPRGNYVAPTPNYSGGGSRGNYVAPTPNYSGGGSRGNYVAPTPNYGGGGSRGNYVNPAPNYGGGGPRGNYVAPAPSYGGGSSHPAGGGFSGSARPPQPSGSGAGRSFGGGREQTSSGSGASHNGRRQ